ncbi:hypothetical protein NV379_18695 [Paenibacillus sp. N1-5-1-14]|uniref:hypothetical protein n=1 Tax=Paenibacillus radicibacter TaxID=2972488 RepID=UPI0021596B38|nr:hypothetical protein [Paenibacillus radicibacter]MCR8644686.1 hypothetical protein [Paenibacillus radicibacter]
MVKNVKIRSFRTISSIRKKTSCKPKKTPISKQIKRLRCYVIKVTKSLSKRIKALSKKVSFLLAATVTLQKKVDQLTRAQQANESQIALLTSQVQTLTAQTLATWTLFDGRMGTQIVIATDGGTVSGTVNTLGTNYVQILEPTGDIVLTPFNNVISVV